MNRQTTTTRRSAQPTRSPNNSTSLVASPITNYSGEQYTLSTVSVILLVTICSVALFSIFIGAYFIYKKRKGLEPITFNSTLLDEPFGTQGEKSEGDDKDPPKSKSLPDFGFSYYQKSDYFGVLSGTTTSVTSHVSQQTSLLESLEDEDTSQSIQINYQDSTSTIDHLQEPLCYSPGTLLEDEVGTRYIVGNDGYPIPITLNT